MNEPSLKNIPEEKFILDLNAYMDLELDKLEQDVLILEAVEKYGSVECE